MRLAMVVERWDWAGSDNDRWAMQIVTHLARRGHAIHVVTACQGDMSPAPANVQLHVWPRLYIGYPRHLQAYAAWARTQLQQASAEATISLTPLVSAQILHFPGGTVRAAAGHAPKVKAHLIQIVLDRIFHQPREHLSTLLRLEEEAVRDGQVRQVLAPNQATVQEYVAHYNLPRERLKIVLPGVETPRLDAAARMNLRQDWRIDAEAPVFLYPVRALHPNLVQAILDAWREVLHHEPRAILLAAGELTYALEHHVVAANLRASVRLIPTTYRREELIPLSDVVVTPTLHAACNRTVLLALTAGVPVITSVGDGTSEWLLSERDQPEEHAGGVVLKNPTDSRELAAAMVKLLTPQVRTACRTSGASWRQRFSMARHIDQIEAVLHGE